MNDYSRFFSNIQRNNVHPLQFLIENRNSKGGVTDLRGRTRYIRGVVPQHGTYVVFTTIFLSYPPIYLSMPLTKTDEFNVRFQVFKTDLNQHIPPTMIYWGV